MCTTTNIFILVRNNFSTQKVCVGRKRNFLKTSPPFPGCCFFSPKKNSGCHRATSGIKAESFVRCSSCLMNTCGLQQLLSHAGGKQAAFYQLTAKAHNPQAQRMQQTTTMKISSPNAPCQCSPSASHPDSVASKLLVLSH